MVVTGDHADIRGWQLLWLEKDGDGNGTPVWDPTRVSSNQSQGKITFGNAALWSDLRGGTIITISDKRTVYTEYEDTTEVTFDLSTDTSYNPMSGDWWIHVSSRQEAGSPSLPLVTSVTNVDGDDPGAFSVGNNDWELRIVDKLGATVFGPIGEAKSGWGGGGIASDEVGKLEANPRRWSATPTSRTARAALSALRTSTAAARSRKTSPCCGPSCPNQARSCCSPRGLSGLPFG